MCVRCVCVCVYAPAVLMATYNVQMLQVKNTPTVLLWGVNDPWITTKKADKILELYPAADFLPIVAGHCPHDEKPTEFNAQLNKWLAMRSL